MNPTCINEVHAVRELPSFEEAVGRPRLYGSQAKQQPGLELGAAACNFIIYIYYWQRG